MSDDMTACPDRLPASQAQRGQAGAESLALNRLPTLQRNALRKLFNRAEFSPAEVAELGYRRLQQAEGIGNKGLSAISTWLRDYGFELSPPEGQAAARPQSRTQRNIELAVRLLQNHGFVVQGGEGACATDHSLSSEGGKSPHVG